jgi:hypothetical protein
LLENVQNLSEKGFRWKRFSGLGLGIGGAGTKKRWGSARYHCSHTDLSVKAMGGFQASHGLFYFCLFYGRWKFKKAMDDVHSLLCFRRVLYSGESEEGPNKKYLRTHQRRKQ